jgi:uncharacterized protein YjiS (DUF1127 family)
MSTAHVSAAMRIASAGPAARRASAGMLLRLSRVLDTLAEWQERSRQRRHLMALNDHLLKDIGLSRADVVRESRKPFWVR